MCRFSDAGNVIYAHARMPGVRKAPRHEIAGRTRGRPCRRLSYGDLSGERGAVSASARSAKLLVYPFKGRNKAGFRPAKHNPNLGYASTLR